MHANIVRSDISKFNSEKPLFCLIYLYAVRNWAVNDAPVNNLNEACSSSSQIQNILYPELSDIKKQIVLGVDIDQYNLERVILH